MVQYPATNLDVSTASEVQSNRCERVNYCDVLSNSGLCTSLALKLSRGLGMVPLDYSTLLHARIYLFIYLYLSIYLFVQCFTYDCLFVWYGYNGKEHPYKSSPQEATSHCLCIYYMHTHTITLDSSFIPRSTVMNTNTQVVHSTSSVATRTIQ